MKHDTDPFYPARDASIGLAEDQAAFLEQAAISLQLPTLFYASLRDLRVFEAVTGRPLHACQREQVRIDGFYPGMADAGTGYPGIFPAQQSQVSMECLLVHDLDPFEQTMIAWYEWDEYALRAIPLADGRRAQAFVPDLNAIEREYGSFEIEAWSFEEWQSGDVDRAVATARQWMAQRPSDAALERAGFFSVTGVSG